MKCKAILISLTLLAACAPSMEGERLKEASGRLAADQARITLYRTDSISFRDPTIMVNGQGRVLNEHESFSIDVKPPGVELVANSWDGGSAELPLQVRKGEQYYVRVADKYNWFKFIPVDAKTAKREMAAAAKE